MRRAPRRERGVVLVAFLAVMSAMLLVGTLGWIATSQKMQLARRQVRMQEYIQLVQKSLDDYVKANYITLSSPSSPVTSDAVMKGAGLSSQYRLTVEVSSALTYDGLPYRAIVAYLPTETDDRNPPDSTVFRTTGKFVTCGDAAGPCVARMVAQATTLQLQQDALHVTQTRLQNLAMRAQLYFKQRVLSDPERRVTVNYYRPTSGDCSTTNTRDLPCHDVAESLLSTARGQTTSTLLALSPDDLRDGWGNEMLVRNGPWNSQGPAGPETVTPPFSMWFVSTDPFNNTVKSVATQPLQ